MRSIYSILPVALVAVVACGGSKPADTAGPGNNDPVPVYKDTRSPIEKRRDTACEAIQPRLTDCAVADAKATMSPKELADLKPDELLSTHKQKFLKECKGAAMSSRQVRVLEVCNHEETECAPLAECLKHLEPQRSEGGAKK
ncbi:MAG: hypothetical protein ABI591_26730 [Kofleriaceae bacterium]